MAERIDYDVKPTPTGPDAREELDRLLNTLHETGALRFANDLAGSSGAVSEVLVKGLGKEETLNAIQNISVLFMALSRIPPADFYKIANGLGDALQEVARDDRAADQDAAPGVTGFYRMLHDEELWRALSPLLGAAKAFSETAASEPEKPITRFTGKETVE